MAEQQDRKPQNIFPLHLLKVCENTQIMVQVKSGQTYNGILKGVDKYMNLKLINAVLTDSSGTHFQQIKQVYIRGNNLKYFNLDEYSLKKLEGTDYQGPQKWKGGKSRNIKKHKKQN